MIIGQCPYEGCDGAHMIPIADKTPCFEKLVCEECHREYWLLHSRIDPQGFTLEEFAAEFDVDEKTKVIKRKHAVRNS
jgi:hypothetical protein